VVCIEGGNTVFTAMIGRVVKQSIFPKKQFLVFDRELDESSKVADMCFKQLQLERSKWPSVKNLVRVRLNRVRNNAQLCVRKKLYRKLVQLFVILNLSLTIDVSTTGYMEQHGVDSIDLKRVLEGRRHRDTFHWFLDNIASVVVSTRVADQVKSIKRPSEWLTRSLEAFGLVCLENFYEMTRKQILHRDSRDKYQARWTADGRGKLKNQGWDQAGIRRYNELCDAVRKDRELYQIEEEVYLNAKQEEKQRMEMVRLKKVEDRTKSREQGLEAAVDDFSSDDDTESD
jgi:hypothetical protein